MTTAPFKPPSENIELVVDQMLPDVDAINLFQERINICTVCEMCIEKNDRPYCKEYDIPLSASANKNSCPIGKW